MNPNKSVPVKFGTISATVLLFCFIVFISDATAQTGTTSPFSRYGIGMLNDKGQAQSFSMGGLIAPLQGDTLSPFGLNIDNPASLAYVRLTTYEAALNNTNSFLISGGQTQGTTATTLGHMALALPIKRWWTSALSLQPLSSVGYKISSVQNQDSIGAVTSKYIGTGGFDKVTLSNGFRFKNLALGFNVSYLFGTVFNERQVVMPSTPLGYFNSQTTSSVNASDFYLDYGLQYGINIRRIHHREMRDVVRIVFGATFTAASNISVLTGVLTQNYIYNGSGVSTIRDTIQNNSNQKNVMRLPTQYSFGLSLRKGDRLFAGIEYSAANWSDYQLMGQSQGLANSQKVVAGIQFTPAHRADGAAPYSRRVTYRFGLRSATLPVVIGGTQLPENAITFGAAFPVGFRNMSTFNTVNLGFELGQRGNESTMKENFFNMVIGISINDRWFVKPKFD